MERSFSSPPLSLLRLPPSTSAPDPLAAPKPPTPRTLTAWPHLEHLTRLRSALRLHLTQLAQNSMPSVLATEVMAQTYVLDTSLARLQLAAPLSLLIFIGASMVSALVASPTLAEISDEYLTILTPNVSTYLCWERSRGGERELTSVWILQSTMIGAYWGILLLLLIGQSLLLSAARTVETKVSARLESGPRSSVSPHETDVALHRS